MENLKILFQKNVPLFCSLFILTVAGSSWAVDQSMDRILEYMLMLFYLLIFR